MEGTDMGAGFAEGTPPEDLEEDRKFAGMTWEADGDQGATSTDLPQDKSGRHTRRAIACLCALDSCAGFPAPLCSAPIVSLSSG